MANHIVPINALRAKANDTLEVTTWPGAQRAGDTAFLISNVFSGSGGREFPAYTATVTHANEGSVKTVRVTVPDISIGLYNLYLSIGGTYVRIVEVRVE